MSESRPASRRVLVVDDEASVCAALESVLALEGHVARTCMSPDEVLDAVRNFAPDLVVLDVQMPGRSGVDVSRELRASFPGLAIILHTGRAAASCDGQYADLVLEKGTVFTFLTALRKFLAHGPGAPRG